MVSRVRLLTGLGCLVAATCLAGCGGGGSATSWSDAKAEVGKDTRVCGPVAGIGYSGDDTFVNLGVDYPDPDRFTIVIWDAGKIKAPGKPKKYTACASGTVTLYKGVPQIEVRSASDVDFTEE